MRGEVLALALAALLPGCAAPGGSYDVGSVAGPPPAYEPFTTCASPEQGRPPSLGEPFHVDFPPQALESTPPHYPQAAIDAGIEGVVVLDVLVCSRGGVADARVRNSIRALDAAAIDAVRRWYWRAAELQGQPVAAWVEVPVTFRLPR